MLGQGEGQRLHSSVFHVLISLSQSPVARGLSLPLHGRMMGVGFRVGGNPRTGCE